MAVKRPTILKTIDADFSYDGTAYDGIPMQVIIDADRIDEDWVNELKVIPWFISPSKHDYKEAVTKVTNGKRLTRTFRIHGQLTNTSKTGTHGGVNGMSYLLSALAIGTQDGGDDKSILTDSGADFITAGVKNGMTIHNRTDESHGQITAVTKTTITATMVDGTDNDWDDGDNYSASNVNFLDAGICKGMTINNTTDGSSGTITNVYATQIAATLSGGTDNDWDNDDVYSISQTAHVKANLLRRMLWDGNAGSAASLSIPGDDDEQPPSQNLGGFVKGLHLTINNPMTITELDALNPNAGVIEVTVDFIVGDQM